MLFLRAVVVFLSASLILLNANLMAEDYSKLVAAELDKLELGAHELDITSSGSKVTLDGWVSSDEDKLQILNLVKKIPEVEEVKDKLDVTSKIVLDDDQAVSARIQEVRQAVDSYVQHSALKGAYSFKYTLDEEGVLIQGSSPAGLQPEALIYAVSREVSTPVRQDIFVRPWPTDKALEDKIKTELLEKLGYNLDGIKISVDQGIVSIEGFKPRHEEIDQIAAAILMLEGVRDLKSSAKYSK